MITALVSGVFGAFNALLPDVMGYFKKKQEMEERQRDRTHELAMMDKTAEVQLKLGAQRLEETRLGGEVAALSAEIKGHFDQMTAIYEAQRPIGVKWVDAWNSALRPAACTLVMFLFGMIATMHSVAQLMRWWDGQLGMDEAAVAMFSGLIGEAIQAVLGYLFGYRGTNAARQYVRS